MSKLLGKLMTVSLCAALIGGTAFGFELINDNFISNSTLLTPDSNKGD